jgi:hypothetical protein
MDLSPLPQTFHRLAALHPRFQPLVLTQPDDGPGGWYALADLAGGAQAQLGIILERAVARIAPQDRKTALSQWFTDSIYGLMLGPFGSYLLAARIPDLLPEHTWVRFDTGGKLAGVAWRSPVFYALPDDPHAGHPECQVVASQAALREQLREQMIAQFSPFIEAIRQQSSFGRPRMWALAADYTAKAFLWVGKQLGCEAEAVRESRAFAAAATPLYRKRAFIEVEQDGVTGYMVDRIACCHKHKIKNRCSSCPDRSRQERIEIILSGLDKTPAAG